MALDLDALHVTSALCTASFVRFRCSSGASPQPRLADAASENSARPRDSAVRPRQTRPVSTTVRNLGTSRSRSSPATEPNRSPARPAPAGFSRLRSRDASRQTAPGGAFREQAKSGLAKRSLTVVSRGASKRQRRAAAGATGAWPCCPVTAVPRSARIGAHVRVGAARFKTGRQWRRGRRSDGETRCSDGICVAPGAHRWRRLRARTQPDSRRDGRGVAGVAGAARRGCCDAVRRAPWPSDGLVAQRARSRVRNQTSDPSQSLSGASALKSPLMPRYRVRPSKGR
jgi:hypothetical protein